MTLHPHRARCGLQDAPARRGMTFPSGRRRGTCGARDGLPRRPATGEHSGPSLAGPTPYGLRVRPKACQENRHPGTGPRDDNVVQLSAVRAQRPVV